MLKEQEKRHHSRLTCEETQSDASSTQRGLKVTDKCSHNISGPLTLKSGLHVNVNTGRKNNIFISTKSFGNIYYAEVQFCHRLIL